MRKWILVLAATLVWPMRDYSKETPASALTEGGKTFESRPGTADPDPANPPAPLPHFDRPRSTPTPPRETGADGE